LRLIRDGKISKPDPVLQIEDEELPFLAPFGWSWERLATISRRIHYGFTASANPSIKDVRLLRITDIQNNFVDWPSVPGCEISEREVEQYKLQSGDILIARTGGTIGKTFLVNQIPVTAVFASYLIRVQHLSAFYDRYLKVFLESPVYWKQLHDGARGGGQPNVNGQTLGKMIVAVPPAVEQRRIVANVDELMALCDQLESAQQERESRRDQLTSASLHRLNQASNGDGTSFRDSASFHLKHLACVTAYKKWADRLTQGFIEAESFLRQLGFYQPKFLPYRAQLIPLAAVLTHLGDRWLEPQVQMKLAKWYWCGVFGELYGSASETRIALDLQGLMKWIDGDSAPEPATVTAAGFQSSRLDTLRSRTSAAYRGLYVLLQEQGAKDFFWKARIIDIDRNEKGIDI
jgi:hypothetical protein